jgi:hypothetical protein
MVVHFFGVDLPKRDFLSYHFFYDVTFRKNARCINYVDIRVPDFLNIKCMIFLGLSLQVERCLSSPLFSTTRRLVQGRTHGQTDSWLLYRFLRLNAEGDNISQNNKIASITL